MGDAAISYRVDIGPSEYAQTYWVVNKELPANARIHDAIRRETEYGIAAASQKS